MRRFVLLGAAAVVAVMAAPAGAGSTFGPGQYQPGPKGGDESTFEEANPGTGEVTIFQHNTRQAAAVHCIGDGPRATLLASQPVTDSISSVTVEFVNAIMTDHPVIDVLVMGSQSDWLGHGAAFGPKNGESGSISIPLSKTPQVGEVVTVTFGLQLHAGCLGHPTMLGLQGSRVVEGGKATFTSVKIG